MRALTIRQPWASAIACGLKDIENRSWKVSYRGPLLIHSSAHVSPQDIREFRDFAIRFMEPAAVDTFLAGYLPRGAVIAIVDLTGISRQSTSPWFVGEFGWHLENVRRLGPVTCKGHQCLWIPGPEILEKL